MCPGGSVPALMLIRSRGSHGGGGVVCRWGWRTQQSAIRRSGGGNPVDHLVGCSSGNNIDDAIDDDNIDDNDMLTEMMMRTDDDPNYITTNQTRTRTRMRMRVRMRMMTMTMTRTRR
jgi:hypothetical protein